ncbi:hypothetical protein [Enterococcus cecorum]|nr:hypothetical protein [Enterococcus cecorum]
MLEKSIYHHILNTLRLKFGPANRRIRAGKPDLYDWTVRKMILY